MFRNQLQGKELTEGEKRAEELAQSFASPHVNFYDPRMFDDLHDEVRISCNAAWAERSGSLWVI